MNVPNVSIVNHSHVNVATQYTLVARFSLEAEIDGQEFMK